jgi:hypothetical protein
VKLVCDGTAVGEPELDPGKLEHAKDLVAEILKTWPERTAETTILEAELDVKGVAKRTGQRALEKLREEEKVDQPKRGYWRLVRE